MSRSDDVWRRRTLAALQDPARRQAALESLARLEPEERTDRIDDAIAATLVGLLGEPDRSRQRHVADLLRVWTADAPTLAAALDVALSALDPRLRWGAAYTTGHAYTPPPRQVWPAVREMLASEDGDQRWAAAELATDLARAHPDVLAEIVANARHGSPTLRRMLLYCLRELPGPELVAVARVNLAHRERGVRLAALSLSPCTPRSPEGNDALAEEIAALVERDPDPGVRRAAAATLGKLGSTRPCVREVLDRAATGTDAGLARAATAARARLGRHGV